VEVVDVVEEVAMIEIGDRDDRRGDGPRRGGPRGDARGPRGGGGSRGGKKEFNLNNDMKDFPTLG